MNLLYCGDEKAEDGILISILSFLKHTGEELNIYIMTMDLKTEEQSFRAVSDETVGFLDKRVKRENPENSVVKVNVGALFQAELPEANMATRFTPYCMLRLFADEIPKLPDRLLYLDADVICRQDCGEFYHQDISGCELAGILDYYGKWFFRRNLFRMDYINSGVLLLNMERIREAGLFCRCRKLCKEKRMFMPDQSAINRLAKKKHIWPEKYNEQRRLREDTVLQHFTTSFRFFPWLHTLTVKPWQVDRMHEKLRLHEYDDILAEYQILKKEIL